MIVWLFGGLVAVSVIAGLTEISAFQSFGLRAGGLVFLGFLYFTLGRSEPSS